MCVLHVAGMVATNGGVRLGGLRSPPSRASAARELAAFALSSRAPWGFSRQQARMHLCVRVGIVAIPSASWKGREWRGACVRPLFPRMHPCVRFPSLGLGGASTSRREAWDNGSRARPAGPMTRGYTEGRLAYFYVE